ARKGDVVALYLTGEGQTIPAGNTGKVTVAAASAPLTPQPIFPVRVTIGNQQATVTFVGEAPGIVSGVLQVNVQIPPSAASGDLPLDVTVGTTQAQTGVTGSVQ